MKKFALIFLLCLNGIIYADDTNITGNLYWRHTGPGKYTGISERGDKNSIPCFKLTGGAISMYINPYMFSPYPCSPVGRFCRFSATLKGKGSAELVLESLVYDKNGKAAKHKTAFKQIELSEKWQNIELSAQEKNPRCSGQIISLTLTSGVEVIIRDTDFRYCAKPGVELSVTPRTTVTGPGAPVELKISLKKDARPLASIPVKITVFDSPGAHWALPSRAFSGEITETEKMTDVNGVINYSFVPDRVNGGVRINAAAISEGAAAEAFVVLADNSQMQKYNKLASAIKITKPVSILFIGDSLSDYGRGYNYIDICKYYLDKYNPGMVTIKNACIGGDYISRIWERVSGQVENNKPAMGGYRKYMYKNLLDPQPDIIFIFLGHNDTRVSVKNGKEVLLVSPEEQYEAYRKFLKYVKLKSPETKIVLMSNTSSDFPKQLQNTARARKAGKPYVLFGTPEHMENFNKVLKELCRENKLNYLDLYSPTKAYPDKAALYFGGVHLSMQGQLFVAEKLMGYLAACLSEGVHNEK